MIGCLAGVLAVAALILFLMNRHQPAPVDETPDSVPETEQVQETPTVNPDAVRITGTASGGRMWYHRFQSGAGGEYTISAVNQSGEPGYLRVVLCDDDGNTINSISAPANGGDVTFTAVLSPNTLYFLKVFNSGSSRNGTSPVEEPADYVVIIEENKP